MPAQHLRAHNLFALLLVFTLTSSCGTNMSAGPSPNLPDPLPTPAWMGVETVGLLCRVSAEDQAVANQVRDDICNLALSRLQQSLGDGFTVDVLVHPDSRVMEANRVTLIFDARLDSHSDSYKGFTLTLSSSQFRHKPGAPPGALFYEPPSVVMISATSSSGPQLANLTERVSPALDQHLRKLMR